MACIKFMAYTHFIGMVCHINVLVYKLPTLISSDRVDIDILPTVSMFYVLIYFCFIYIVPVQFELLSNIELFCLNAFIYYQYHNYILLISVSLSLETLYCELHLCKFDRLNAKYLFCVVDMNLL